MHGSLQIQLRNTLFFLEKAEAKRVKRERAPCICLFGKKIQL